MTTRMMHIYEGRRGKFKKVREHDYIYDPNFVLSGEKDFERQATKSAMATAQFTIHPVFNTMFSEVKKYDRVQILCHPNARLPPHVDMSYSGTGAARRAAPDIEGPERILYYAAPKVQTTMIVHQEMEPEPLVADQPVEGVVGKPQHKGVQTLFRESSAQTDPYQPDYRIHRKCKEIPEILLLQDIQFGPPEVAVHWGAVRAVQRQRVRRAWLQSVMDARALGALEEYEHRYREKELENILLLQEERLGPRMVSVADRGLGGRLWQEGARRLHAAVQGIRRSKERDLRKLEAKRKKLFSGKKEIRCPSTLVRKPVQISVDMDYLPCDFDLKPQLVNLSPRKPLMEGLCDKMSRRNDECLQKLTQDLKETVATSEDSEEETDEPKLCKTMDISVESEECLLLQDRQSEMEREMAADALLAMLKGRAAQTKVYEGLSRNTELINELQFVDNRSCKTPKQADETDWYWYVKNRVIGQVLDLLNKELDHIMEKRRQKEFVDSAIVERQVREAAEAGRRQQEERRRREHQEMYEQVVQMTKQAAAVHLHDLFVEVSNRDADVEAEKRTVLEAQRIDRHQRRMSTRLHPLKDEDLIAELVMDCILPEVVERIQRIEKNFKMCSTPGIITDALFGAESGKQAHKSSEEQSDFEEEDQTKPCYCKTEGPEYKCICIQEEVAEEEEYEEYYSEDIQEFSRGDVNKISEHEIVQSGEGEIEDSDKRASGDSTMIQMKDGQAEKSQILNGVSREWTAEISVSAREGEFIKSEIGENEYGSGEDYNEIKSTGSEEEGSPKETNKAETLVQEEN